MEQTRQGADPKAREYRERRRQHWDAQVGRTPHGPGLSYHQRLVEIFRQKIPPGRRVLELGCGRGELLAALEPSVGVGVDFSPRMVEAARARFPHLRFELADVHALELEGPFDAIVLSDLVHDLWDVQEVLTRLQPLCGPHTRLVFNFFSRVWQLPLSIAQSVGLATPSPGSNWLTPDDVAGLLHLADFEVLSRSSEVLLPMAGVGPLFNKGLVKLWPLSVFGLTNVMVARPRPRAHQGALPRVSVVVPARNEAGNIEAVLSRTPEMGAGTEIVFVEGGSSDDTWEVIQRACAAHPERRTLALQQTGRGKGDAVRAGFQRATGEVLMILDADLTVPPEDLPRFFEALLSGKGEFINGVRLVYPMEDKAMPYLNLLANRFFSATFTWLLGQPIKDTLCGTKVLRRADYEAIAAGRAWFGDFDPFGDFDLLFGAARLGLKLVDLPIRYRERTYGTTNISRWSHGWLLLRMCVFAARRIKFI